MPMLCCSPDFTNPNPDMRRRAVEREAELIRVTRRLGGPRAVCRVLSGQRYPDVELEEGLEWVVSCIDELLPVARSQLDPAFCPLLEVGKLSGEQDRLKGIQAAVRADAVVVVVRVTMGPAMVGQ